MAVAEAPAEHIAGQQNLEGGEAPAAAPEEIILSGTSQLGLFDAGGKQPTAATLSISGLSGMKLFNGQALKKGGHIRFEGVARVDDVGQKDKLKHGVVVSCVQRHIAAVTDVRVLGEVDGPALEESDAPGALRRAVAALREQGMTDEGIAGIAGLPVV